MSTPNQSNCSLGLLHKGASAPFGTDRSKQPQQILQCGRGGSLASTTATLLLLQCYCCFSQLTQWRCISVDPSINSSLRRCSRVCSSIRVQDCRMSFRMAPPLVHNLLITSDRSNEHQFNTMCRMLSNTYGRTPQQHCDRMSCRQAAESERSQLTPTPTPHPRPRTLTPAPHPRPATP